MATGTITNPKNITYTLTAESHLADYYTNSWLATAKSGIYRVTGGGSSVSSSILYGASNYYGILEVLCESNSGSNYGAIVFYDAQNRVYYRNFNRESNVITWRGSLEGDNFSNGTITRYTATTTSGTFEQYQCYKTGGVACVGARIHTISDSGATANKKYFELPSGFRPRTATRVMAWITIGGSTVTTSVMIETDGSVTLGYGSGVITQVGFVGTFPV